MLNTNIRRVLTSRFLITLLASFFITAPEIALTQSPEVKVTTVFIVRHAERCDQTPPFQCKNYQDPELSRAGLARAEELKNVLAEAKIDAIFSTDTTRTTQTADPVANLLGFKRQWKNECGPDPKEDKNCKGRIYSNAKGVADEVKNKFAGQRILIVSHSGDYDKNGQYQGPVGEIVSQLNGDKNACPILASDYDKLCVVTFGESVKTEVVNLHYGTTPPSYLPDLVINRFSYSPIEFTVVVKNQGPVATQQKTFLELKIAGSQQGYATSEVPPLEPNGERIIKIKLNRPLRKPGDYQATVRVDPQTQGYPNGFVLESNEDNNSSTLDFTVENGCWSPKSCLDDGHHECWPRNGRFCQHIP